MLFSGNGIKHLVLAAAEQCLNSTIFNPPTPEALRLGVGKRLEWDITRTPDSSWPEIHSIPCHFMLSNKSQEKGGAGGRKGAGED